MSNVFSDHGVVERLRTSSISVIACLAITSFSTIFSLLSGCSKEAPTLPRKGSVGALRASAPKRSQPEKARIDRLIKKRFVPVTGNAFSTITLTDGSVVIAKDVREQDSSYILRAAQNEENTIFAIRTIEKSEVKSIVDEGGEATMWRKIKGLRLPKTSLDGYYHDRIITLVFDHFLSEYPNTQHTQKVRDMREAWVNEKTTLDGNWIKVKGEWYSPKEISPDFLFSIDRIEAKIADGHYLEAARLCSEMRIPHGFPADLEQFRATRDSIHDGLHDFLRSQKSSADKKRSALKVQYEMELARISRKKGLARPRSHDPNFARRKIERAAAKQNYEQALREVNEKIYAIEAEIHDVKASMNSSP